MTEVAVFIMRLRLCPAKTQPTSRSILSIPFRINLKPSRGDKRSQKFLVPNQYILHIYRTFFNLKVRKAPNSMFNCPLHHTTLIGHITYSSPKKYIALSILPENTDDKKDF